MTDLPLTARYYRLVQNQLAHAYRLRSPTMVRRLERIEAWLIERVKRDEQSEAPTHEIGGEA